MKKILIATTALAFAGSAFAADVSGYAISAYSKKDSTKSLYTESEVYLSGSKTASNGLTFGATYTLGFDGDSARATGVETTMSAPTPIPTKQKADVNAFVSGSFGKVQMGKHSAASKSTGVASIQAGNGLINTASDATRINTLRGVTYTSPVFSGAQFAYTTEFGDTKTTSYALKYSKSISGLDLAIAHSSVKDDLGTSSANKKHTSNGISVSKAGFSASYSIAKTKVGASADVKTKRMGVGYSANKVTVGYAVSKKEADKVSTTKETNIYAAYAVVSGLSVFAESNKVSGSPTATDNVKSTWIGTNISF